MSEEGSRRGGAGAPHETPAGRPGGAASAGPHGGDHTARTEGRGCDPDAPETRPRRRTRDPAVLAWLRLVRVYQQVSRAAAECVRASGLTLAQFDVLAQVGAAEGRSQQALADRLLVTKGNVTQILDRMEACGLLVRRQVGRTKCVSLTERGREVRASVVPALEAVIADRLRALSPEEQRTLLRLLREVDRDLESRPEETPEEPEETRGA